MAISFAVRTVTEFVAYILIWYYPGFGIGLICLHMEHNLYLSNVILIFLLRLDMAKYQYKGKAAKLCIYLQFFEVILILRYTCI